MIASIDILSIANNLASHAYKRQGLIAENIANSDTPGYQSKDLSDFSKTLASDFSMRVTRAGHTRNVTSESPDVVMTTSGFGGYSPNGNNVSIEDQMLKSADVKMQHDLALGVYQKSMSILRASLGRR